MIGSDPLGTPPVRAPDSAWEKLGRLAWLCPLLGLGLAALALMVFGLSIWSAGLAALLLVCPLILVWGPATDFAGRRRHRRIEP